MSIFPSTGCKSCLEGGIAALRRKCSVAAAPLPKSISLFLGMCGVWEGNAGNQEVWLGEEVAGGADRLLLRLGPLVPVFSRAAGTVVEAEPMCVGNWPPLRWKRPSSDQAKGAQLGKKWVQMDNIYGLGNGAIPGPEPDSQARERHALCCHNSWFSSTSAGGLSPPQAFLLRFQARPRDMYFLPRGTGPSLILAAYSRRTLPSECLGVNSPPAHSRYPAAEEHIVFCPQAIR